MEHIRDKKRKGRKGKYLPLYLMLIPGFTYLLFNNYLPMAGMAIAFKRINFAKGIFKSDWIGFENFQYLFRTQDAFIITRNTLLYNIVFIVLGMILGISIAILLNEIKNRIASRVYQSVVLIPYLFSMVIVSYLVYAFLSVDTGFLNKTVLPALGIDSIPWYTEKQFWPFILTFVHLWKGFGFSCIIYLANIVGIDKQYYEAAMLDGATRWQQITKITIPMLKPTIITLAILQIGRIFYSDFGLFYQVPLNSGALYPVTNTIDTYVFRGLLQTGDIGMSSAAGMYQSIVGFALVIVSNLIIRKISREDALF